MAEKRIPAIVKAFEDFSIFCRTKWRAAILGVFFIALLGSLFLLLYFGYKKIDSLGNSIEKSVDILEETHSTPESLQKGLIDSVAENLIIEKELSKILLNSENGTTALFFKFHNSKMDLQGKHDFFYSAMNEITKNQDYVMMNELQNVPITALGQYMIPFIEGRCQTVLTENIVSNNWLKKKFEKDKINALSSCPVHDVTGKYLLGFVEIVYVEDDIPARDISTIERCLKDSANRVSIVISKEIDDLLNK